MIRGRHQDRPHLGARPQIVRHAGRGRDSAGVYLQTGRGVDVSQDGHVVDADDDVSDPCHGAQAVEHPRNEGNAGYGYERFVAVAGSLGELVTSPAAAGEQQRRQRRGTLVRGASVGVHVGIVGRADVRAIPEGRADALPCRAAPG